MDVYNEIKKLINRNEELAGKVARLEQRVAELEGFILKKNKPLIDREVVIDAILEYFNISFDDLASPCRKADVVKARHFYIYMLRKYCGLTYAEIGRSINRHHTTAINSERVVYDLISVDDEYRTDNDNLNKLINQFTQ